VHAVTVDTVSSVEGDGEPHATFTARPNATKSTARSCSRSNGGIAAENGTRAREGSEIDRATETYGGLVRPVTNDNVAEGRLSTKVDCHSVAGRNNLRSRRRHLPPRDGPSRNASQRRGNGSLTDSGTKADAMFTPAPVLYCPDSGTVSRTSADASDDAGDATMSATVPAVDAGCFYVKMGGSTPSAMLYNAGTCASPNLSGGYSIDGGVVEDAAGLVSASGGLSTIPCSYVLGVGSGCYSGGGETVTGESTTGYTITGLTNGRTYDVVVASVDGYGNVGPASSCVHDFPAPVNDFLDMYANDGGKAGGGFCALLAVGLAPGSPTAFGGVVAVAIALSRRRRKRT
jgi:hypothetical protein